LASARLAGLHVGDGLDCPADVLFAEPRVQALQRLPQPFGEDGLLQAQTLDLLALWRDVSVAEIAEQADSGGLPRARLRPSGWPWGSCTLITRLHSDLFCQ
jgi:hypothetical protein